MRLSDLVVTLRGELQHGLDRAIDDRDPEATGPRFDVRSVEVDLPFAVTAGEDGESPGESEMPASDLDIRPGGGDGRLTFQFGPSVESGAPEPSGELDQFPTGIEFGELLDEEGAVEDSTDEDEGPIIPDVDEEYPGIVFDVSVPMDFRAGTGTSVEAVEGIGPKRAKALEGMDVTSIAELAAADPVDVANELATTEEQATRLVGRARFMDLGADPQLAELLVDEGVSPEQLLEEDPESLLDRLKAIKASDETAVPASYEPQLEDITRLVDWAEKRRV